VFREFQWVVVLFFISVSFFESGKAQTLAGGGSVAVISQIKEGKARAVALRSAGEYERALQAIDSTLLIASDSEGDHSVSRELGWLWANRAYITGQLQGRILQSKADYLKALPLLEEAGEEALLIGKYVQKPLGNVYTRLGDYGQAVEQLEAVRKVAMVEHDSATVLDATNDVSIARLEMGMAKRCIRQLQGGLAYAGKSRIARGLLLSNMVRGYAELQQLDSADRCAREALRLLRSVGNDTSLRDKHRDALRYQLGTYNVWIPLLARLNQRLSMEDAVQEASRIAQVLYAGELHRKEVKLRLAEADGYFILGDFDRAQRLYQEAEEQLKNLEKGQNRSFYPDQLFVVTVMGNIRCLRALYEVSPTDDSLAFQILQAYQQLFRLEREVRSELLSTGAQHGHMERFHRFAGEAIAFSIQQYHHTGDMRWLEGAVGFVAYSQGVLLAQSVERHALAAASEDTLWSKLFELEMALADMRYAKDADPGTIRALRQDKAGLMQQLKERNPVTYDQWFSRDQLSLETLFDVLEAEERSVLLLFDAGAELHLFLLQSGRIHLHTLSMDATVLERMRGFRQCLANPECDANSFQSEAHTLHELLLDSLPLASKALVIVPDGRFHQLPFEVLVTDLSRSPDFRSLHYLLRQLAVSYAPSLSFLQRGITSRKYPYALTVVQPSFECNDSLVSLPELSLPGSIHFISGAQATADAFLSHSGQTQVAHLSTHGFAALNDSGSSWIALAGSASCTHPRLHFDQIRHRSFSCDLVVLQACQSAGGQVLAGEGAFSISNGFLHAGSNNVLATRWDANPEASSYLLSSFYHHLEQEQIPAALRKAQLEYLNSETLDALAAHPFYWAGFSVYGKGYLNDSFAISNTQSMDWRWGLLLVGLILLFWLWRRSRA